MADVELRVARGHATRGELQETIDEILAEIAAGEGEVASDARATGFVLDGTTTISVVETGQGFEPVSMLVLAFAGGVGKGLAKKFWEDVLWPEIRRRRGSDSVGDVEDD